MVLNSHTLPLKARHFRLERLLKGLGSLWWQVKRFVATEWGIEENGIQQPGFSFFKSFSLKTFIAFVTLLRNTVTNVARDAAALWTGTELTVVICERRSVVFIGLFPIKITLWVAGRGLTLSGNGETLKKENFLSCLFSAASDNDFIMKIIIIMKLFCSSTGWYNMWYFECGYYNPSLAHQGLIS